MKKPKKPAGVILYRGPSLLDPSTEVVLIATFKSSNRKTGDMIQTWIIETGRRPTDARHDVATCGDCPVKPFCYVNQGQAPQKIFNAFVKGNYPIYTPELHAPLFHGREMRKGADGDPAAIPAHVWRIVDELIHKSTSYTHQWETLQDVEYWQGRTMASISNEFEKERANAAGFMTFRIVHDYAEKLHDEIICPADSKKKKTCINCMFCSGKHTNVVIKVHGSKKRKFK